MEEYIEREAAIKTINKLRIGLRTQGAYEFDLVAAEAKHRVESIPIERKTQKEPEAITPLAQRKG